MNRSGVTQRIVQLATAKGRGAVFTPSDFLHLGSRAAVDQALSRIARAGRLRRVARGLYDYPRIDPQLGPLTPSTDAVAQALRVRAARLLFAVLVGSNCGGSPVGPSEVATGNWGGDHIAMTVASSSAHIEFDCAHADVPTTLRVNKRGEFNAAGTFVREHGGPIRVGELPDAHPAVFAGSVTATALAVTIRLSDNSDVIGTFSLAHGATGRVVKCL